MKLPKPEWDDVAPYYDDLFGNRTVDVPFWTKLTKTLGSPVIELGCGTGRLTFPIAQTGATITGLDISKPMLAQARKKYNKLPASVRKRVTLVTGNAFSFHLSGKFRAIYSPWGFMPVGKRQQHSLMRSAIGHLEKNGYFVIDIENLKKPRENWDFSRLVSQKKLPSGVTLIRHARHQGSYLTRIGSITYTLDVLDHGKNIKHIVTRRHVRVYTPDDLKKLLVDHGFSIVKVYGDYDFSAWRPSSPKAIFLAQLNRPSTLLPWLPL